LSNWKEKDLTENRKKLGLNQTKPACLVWRIFDFDNIGFEPLNVIKMGAQIASVKLSWGITNGP